MAKPKKFKLTAQDTETPKQAPETAPPPPAPEENPQAEDLVSSASDAPEAAAVPDWDNVPLPEAETAPEPVISTAEGGGDGMPMLTPEGFISYDAFHEGFCKACELGGHIGQLQTLLQAPKQPSCPDATRAVYDIAVETPALHFIIKPGSIWVQRAFAIGSFAVPVTLGCVAEIRIKAAAQAETLTDIQEGEEQHAE